MREATVVPKAIRKGKDREEGQAALSLVLVPFEAVPEEESVARRKQTTKVKRLHALTAAQDVL